MAKAYATVADVEAILVRTLTPEEQARSQDLLEAATVAFDRETGQAWAEATAIVGETRPLVGPDLYLGVRPVASVERVSARVPAIGAAAQDLVAGSTYDLIDAVAGRLRVAAAEGAIVVVDYTPALVPPPLDVAEAVAQWATVLLTPTLEPGRAGVEQVSVAMGEATLRYRDPLGADAAKTGGLPPAVAAVVDRYRRTVWS